MARSSDESDGTHAFASNNLEGLDLVVRCLAIPDSRAGTSRKGQILET